MPPAVDDSLPHHIRTLPKIPFVGKVRLKDLAKVYPTERDFAAATVNGILNAPGTHIRQQRIAIEIIHARDKKGAYAVVERAVMWNTLTEQKVTGPCAPTLSELERWMVKHPGHVRYVGQDMDKKSALEVPRRKQMDTETYRQLCLESDSDRSFTHLQQNAREFGLEVETMNDQPTYNGKSLVAALSETWNYMFGQQLDFVQQLLWPKLKEAGGDAFKVQGGSDAVKRFLNGLGTEHFPAVLRAASSLFGRQFCVLTGDTDPCVVLITEASDAEGWQGGGQEGEMEGGKAEQPLLPPVWLAQDGGRFWRVCMKAERGSSSKAAAPSSMAADNAGSQGSDVVNDKKPLPELKENLKRMLSETRSLLGNIAALQQSKGDDDFAVSGISVSDCRKEVEVLEEQLTIGCGRSAAFVGHNGIGKSTLINLLLFNSSGDNENYEPVSVGSQYVPEALCAVYSKADTPLPLKATNRNEQLTLGRAETQIQISIKKLRPAQETVNTKQGAEVAVKKLTSYCKSGRLDSVLPSFVLPTDGIRSTTKRVIGIQSGKIVHLHEAHFRKQDLQERAFEFCKEVRKVLGEDGSPRSEQLDEVMKGKWEVYKLVTGEREDEEEWTTVQEKIMEESLQPLPQSPEAIVLCAELEEILEQRHEIHCGEGKSLHLDRCLLQDQLKEIMKNPLRLLAIKKLTVYLPSAMLEGGNVLLDLPGGNDDDPMCEQQTNEGVLEAGCIFVMLSKTLEEDKDTKSLLTSKAAPLVLQGTSSVVFLICREHQAPCAPRDVDQLLHESEDRRVTECIADIREQWREVLDEAMEALNANTERSKILDQEVNDIALKTEIRAIYPAMHTSLLLNSEFRKKNPDKADQVLDKSGIYWLLGRLEAMHRDAIVAIVRRLAKVSLPTLCAKMRRTLDRAKSGGGQVPERLLRLAQNMPQHTRKEQAENLDNFCNSLLTTLKKELDDMVDLFVGKSESDAADNGSNEVSKVLSEAERLQSKHWKALKETQMKKPDDLLRALHPSSKGKAKGVELLPVAFGLSPPFNLITINFEPLFDAVECCIGRFRRDLLENIVEAIGQMADDAVGSDSNIIRRSAGGSGSGGSGGGARNSGDSRGRAGNGAGVGGSGGHNGGDSGRTSNGPALLQPDSNKVLSLMCSFQENVESSLARRLSVGKFYYTGKNEANLKHKTQVLVEMQKLAAEACVAAFRKTTLKVERHVPFNALSTLVEKSFAACRKEYRKELAHSVKKLLAKQVKRLCDDLTGTGGLLSKFFLGFLEYVVATDTLENSSKTDSKVLLKGRKLLLKVENLANKLHLLHLQAREVEDPAKVGKAMSQRLSLFKEEKATSHGKRKR
mmetsp:Transcript_18871/g.39964  ORF Transcript_18871/g.39964 Transcript_18871/m.39964 type:complete len:1342 (-) Transcript_18871:110-4135(-)